MQTSASCAARVVLREQLDAALLRELPQLLDAPRPRLVVASLWVNTAAW